MPPDADREIEGEVTRIAAVEYLGGATGHAVGSLGLLGFGALGTWVTGNVVIGLGGLVCAWLLSLNGLSLFAWDRVRDAILERVSRSGETADRTLTRPALSDVHKAELVGGFVQVVGLVVVVSVSIELSRRFGARTGAYLLGVIIAVGNLVGLFIARRSASD